MISRFFDWLVGVPRHEFSESTPRPIDQLFAELRGSGSAPRVGRTEALSVPAVQRGRNLLCSIATLPLVQLGPDRQPVRNPLLEQIDPDVPNIVTLTQTVEDVVFEGIAWWQVTAFAADGFPMSARRLDPGTVSVTPPGGRSPSPLPAGEDPRGGIVYVDGRPVPGRQMIRYDSPNPAVLKVGGRAIKRALLLDQAARMYADDPRALDYFTPAEIADPLDDDEMREFLGEWRSARKSRSTAYVPAAVKYNTVDSPTPHDLQLVELQRQATLEIANAFGVDPEDLGVSTTSRTYANAVDRRRDRINDVLMPFMRAITDRLSMGDVTKRGHKVVFDLDQYMQSNPTERWSVYATGKNLGVLTVEEIRAKEGMPELAEPVEEPAPTAELEAARLRVVGFSEQPTAHRFTFDGEVTEFAVDAQSRTITGLAVPYGKVGVKYGLRFRFRKGSLRYTEVSRVKHYKDHVTPVGKALALKDTRAGLVATLSVASGPTGDELLTMAAEGVYDGLSVGVEFDLDPESGDVQLARDGVYDVLRADLREITTTAQPSFDDARVTRVAASRDGGTMDPCATCGQEHAPNVACPTAPTTTPAAAPTGQTPAAQQWTAEQLEAAFSAAPHGVMAALLGLNTPGAREATAAANAATEPRQVVNAARPAPNAVVGEPAPYRFDRAGNLCKGSHDFSTDFIAATRDRDDAANDRVLDFLRVQFDVATGDVNELNPARNRPEMYVDQREFKYPVWDAISKGTLTDITPFVFPKFSSASGLVAAHTEGVEPSSGTYVTTSQTVTPTAVSGKAKITRETWEQGGNPQVSNLIWQQILRSWFEALEAAAVALLDAATPTALATFTAGGGTDRRTLVAELTAGLAGLQFVRGGYRFTDGFAQVDLYKHLVEAKDADGRPLLPMIGPNNSNGQVESRFGAVQVGGTLFYPAWALAASGSVAASSYLFDRGDVHGWASVPQRLTFDLTEVAHVYLGVWGYKATAISDITGVRELTYDPVP